MQHRLPYSAPDGYLDTVSGKILNKVRQSEQRPRGRFVPYFAFAAMLAIIVGGGTLFLRSVTPETDVQGGVAVIDSAHIDSVVPQSSSTAQALSDEDIVNYLIYCGYDF